MAEENTEDGIASIPPSFMQGDAQKVEEAREEAARAAAKEETAQKVDGADILSATIIKATGRLKEQATYLDKIDEVLGKSLAFFVAENPLGQVVDLVVDWETQVDAVDTALKAIKAKVALCREVMLPERLDADETRTHTSLNSGHRMSRTTRILAGVRAGEKEAAMEWLRKPVFYEDPTPAQQKVIDDLRQRIVNGEEISASEFPVLQPKMPWVRNDAGEIVLSDTWNDEAPDYGSLIQETINASSLSALAKELRETGALLPSEIFNVHEKDGVSITKGKKK